MATGALGLGKTEGSARSLDLTSPSPRTRGPTQRASSGTGSGAACGPCGTCGASLEGRRARPGCLFLARFPQFGRCAVAVSSPDRLINTRKPELFEPFE